MRRESADLATAGHPAPSQEGCPGGEAHQTPEPSSHPSTVEGYPFEHRQGFTPADQEGRAWGEEGGRGAGRAGSETRSWQPPHRIYAASGAEGLPRGCFPLEGVHIGITGEGGESGRRTGTELGKKRSIRIHLAGKEMTRDFSCFPPRSFSNTKEFRQEVSDPKVHTQRSR